MPSRTVIFSNDWVQLTGGYYFPQDGRIHPSVCTLQTTTLYRICSLCKGLGQWETGKHVNSAGRDLAISDWRKGWHNKKTKPHSEQWVRNIENFDKVSWVHDWRRHPTRTPDADKLMPCRQSQTLVCSRGWTVSWTSSPVRRESSQVHVIFSVQRISDPKKRNIKRLVQWSDKNERCLCACISRPWRWRRGNIPPELGKSYLENNFNPLLK